MFRYSFLFAAFATTAFVTEALIIHPVSGASEGKTDAVRSSLTGTYKCAKCHGQLNVLELPGKKIQFGLSSEWIGKTPQDTDGGQCSAVIPIKNGVASYTIENKRFTLTMRFQPTKCLVTYSGEGFSGPKVNPQGTYIKVSSKRPAEHDIEPWDCPD